MKTAKVTGILTLFVGMLLLSTISSCNKGPVKGRQQQVQNFSLIEVEPQYTADEVQYDVKVFFTMPLEEEEALKVFSPDFVSKYNVTANYLGDRKYNYHLSNMKRGGRDSSVEMVLDGKPLNSKSKVTHSLNVCAKNVFAVVTGNHNIVLSGNKKRAIDDSIRKMMNTVWRLPNKKRWKRKRNTIN